MKHHGVYTIFSWVLKHCSLLASVGGIKCGLGPTTRLEAWAEEIGKLPPVSTSPPKKAERVQWQVDLATGKYVRVSRECVSDLDSRCPFSTLVKKSIFRSKALSKSEQTLGQESTQIHQTVKYAHRTIVFEC